MKAPVRHVIIAVLAVTLIALACRWFGFGPLSQPEEAPARLYAASLITGSEWLALALWFLTGSIVIPFIEEVLFRFALLRTITVAIRSSTLAIFITAAAFALLHIGRLSSPRTVGTGSLDIMLLFVLSIVLGAYARSHGRALVVPVIAHAVFNALAFASIVGSSTL